MRFIFIVFICSLLFVSCKGRLSREEAKELLSVMADSALVFDSAYDDDVEAVPEVYEEELFDDFIFNFSTDEQLQKERIQFPLVVISESGTDTIPSDQWEHDELFNLRNYYTLLFDKEEDMDLIGNIDIDSVSIEWINIPEKLIKQYDFRRDNGRWALNAIVKRQLEKADNTNFLSFFYRFSTDSLYQARMVRRPLKFITIDPDDDFSIIETTLDVNQWFAFKPDLPVGKLTNIDYGQMNKSTSNRKILALKGLDNGFSNLLYFRRKSGNDWELYKFEDISM